MSGPDKQSGHRIADVEKQKRADAKDRKRDDYFRHRANDAIAGAINRVADQLATNEDAQDSSEKNRNVREYITIFLVLCTFIAAAVGDWIFYRTMVEDGRAWVSVDHISNAWVAPYLMFKIHLINTGRSPATDISIWKPKLKLVAIGPNHFEQLGTTWPTKDHCEKVHPTHLGMLLLPGSKEGLTGEAGVLATSAIIPGAKALLAGKAGLLIVGCVVYRTYGEIHHEQYCFLERRGPDKRVIAVPCTEGTYAN